MSDCNYQSLTQQFMSAALDPTPAELQGALCGMLCVQINDIDQRCDELWFSGTDPDDVLVQECRKSVRDMAGKASEVMQSEDMSLQLCLPEAGEGLAKRSMALIDWCEGFLFGLGLAGEATVNRLSPEAQEAIEDFVQITKLDFNEVTDGEEDEEALFEVEEYIRMATFLIREDLNAARQSLQ